MTYFTWDYGLSYKENKTKIMVFFVCYIRLLNEFWYTKLILYHFKAELLKLLKDFYPPPENFQ